MIHHFRNGMETKELTKAPVYRERQLQVALKNYTNSFDAQDGESNELWSEEFKAWVDGSLLKSLFYSDDWVFICVDLIASKLSSQPLRVMKKDMVDGKPVSEIDYEHPLNNLLAQPNEHQDYSAFMYHVIVELFLMGNSVIWNAPSKGYLITLNAETISLEFDNKGVVKKYLVASMNDESQPTSLAEFDSKNIIHIRRPNPNSLLWGLSPWIPARKSVLFNRYSTDYLNAFYIKQATPSMALSMDRTVNEDVALRQLRSFEAAYSGRKNSRKTLILPKGVSATPLSHTLSDQKLLDHINQNRETILAILKIPKHEVGLQTAGSLGSEEYKTALRNFWESTLKPAADMIAGSFTKFFQNDLGEDHHFEFDLTDVEALQDDLKQKAETAKLMLEAGYSINEVRSEVWELEEYEDADASKPYVLVNKPSQLQQFQQPPAASEEKSLPMPKAINKLRKCDELERRRNFCTKALNDEESRTISQLGKSAIDLLIGMTSLAIEYLDTNSTKAMATKADIPSERKLKRDLLRLIEDGFEESWQNDIARTLSKSVETGYDSQVGLVFNQEAKREIEVLRARDASGRKAQLTARGLESFAQVSNTHTDRIISEIAKAQKEGEAIGRVMERVANLLGTPDQLRGKAEAIARTETLTAVSIGQKAALDDAVEVIPGMKKAWLTAGDGRVRDSHAALDGDVVGAKEKFANGLSNPRDVNGDADQVINCRCSLLIVSPEDEDILNV